MAREGVLLRDTACCMLVPQTNEASVQPLPWDMRLMVTGLVLARILPQQSRPDGVRGDPQMSVGKQLKQILDIDSSVRIGYLAHVRGPASPAQQ
jgi:hypothetical protein